MLLDRAVCPAVAFGSLLLLCLAAGASADSRMLLQSSASSQKAELRPLAMELKRTGGAAEVYYRAVCRHVDGQDILLFPHLVARSPLKPHAEPAVIQSIFPDTGNVIAEDRKAGLTRLTIGGGAPPLLLSTRIATLGLSPIDQFDPQTAISILLSDASVRSALKKLGLHPVRGVAIYPIQSPDLGEPHLPPTIRNATFGDILDTIARTFHGIVLVGVCDTPSLYSVEFVSPEAILRTR
jgi:hypothetical protein